MTYRDDRSYSADHEWASVADGVATIGISDFAQNSLGDIVYVDLPSVGDTISAGDDFGEVESVKSVSELIAPVSGEVIEVNDSLSETPEVVNSDPHGEGWMVKVALSDPGEIDGLMKAEEYTSFIEG